MSTPDLRALLAFWTPVLRVQDWQIEALYDPKLEALGVCYADHVYRRAKIVVQPTQDDVEASLVHELLHLHFAPFETEGGSSERTEEERAVESLMRGYIDLRRSGAPDVQTRARGAFEARLRARPPSFPGRGGPGVTKERTSMDPVVLAAIRAALAAEDPAIAKESALKMLAELEKAGGGGGEMAPASATQPPMAEPPPVDPTKPPAAEPPPGEKEPPVMRAPVSPEIDARLRAIESTLATEAKARTVDTEKKRAALYTSNEARIPEAGRAFAKSLDHDKLDAYLRTLPASAPTERQAGPTRGPARQGSPGADPERLGRLRTAMGIPDPSAKLPGRDERGRRTWPANEPSKLRKALAAGTEGGAS